MGSGEIYEGFKYKISWNPMGSDEILIKSNGIWWNSWSFLSIKSDEIH